MPATPYTPFGPPLGPRVPQYKSLPCSERNREMGWSVTRSVAVPPAVGWVKEDESWRTVGMVRNLRPRRGTVHASHIPGRRARVAQSGRRGPLGNSARPQTNPG